ncbi:hypothetical protein [Pseudomonas sp. PDM19]|uniref:hypothetical protein n=1 Tax=Pseudomonas sp. PDM19 TaxID=2769272 RepID=UPI00177C30CB|nr:hypothetical protein [Pseudomonas sp. PDM19]MBD9632877.1 hypothetical protein [Pseudomonas sp. PDM19]
MRQALLLLALLAGFSSSAFAEEYYWYMVNGDRYPSPQAACDGYVAKGYPTTGLRNAVAEAYVLPMDTKISFRCHFYNQLGENYGRLPLSRGGDTCSGSYDTNTGICTRPSDAECKTRGNYTKTIQFSYTDGGAVLELDPEIKDGCVYEPGTPDSCDDNVCTVDMIPVGNDDMSDNPDNPDQQLQDYLDELAKKFECSKTANGTVGCTGAQTTPPRYRS